MKNKLKIFRATKNLTQEEVAEMVGVTRQTLNAIEKGKYSPTLSLAYDIADIFDVNVEEIFLRTENESGIED